MKFRSTLVAILIGIAILAFSSGYWIARKNEKRFIPVEQAKAVIRTNGINLYPYLNPLTECIRSKGLRMEELKTFKPKIEKYIFEYCKTHKGAKVSYYFRDLNNGMWIGLNEKELFSPASLMKVPTLVAVLKEAQTNPALLQNKIEYKDADFVNFDEEAGFKKTDGQFYSIEELLVHSVGYSDNAATLMLMNAIGMDKVIKVEDDMNLHVGVNFNDQTNFVSVKNYAGVFRILYNGAYLNETMSEKAIELLLNSKYQGGIRAAISSEIGIAHKYGERDIRFENGKRITQQLHHFGIVYHPEKPFVIGIMTKGENSKEEKEKIITDLARITYEEVNSQIGKIKPERNRKYLQNM